jgi:hypothetical protein
MSKLKEKPPEGILTAVVQRLISLKLIKGWVLVEKDVMDHMAKEQLRLENTILKDKKAFNLLKLEVQEKENEVAVHEQQTKDAIAQRDEAKKRCITLDLINQDLIDYTKKLEELEKLEEKEPKVVAKKIRGKKK